MTVLIKGASKLAVHCILFMRRLQSVHEKDAPVCVCGREHILA